MGLRRLLPVVFLVVLGGVLVVAFLALRDGFAARDAVQDVEAATEAALDAAGAGDIEGARSAIMAASAALDRAAARLDGVPLRIVGVLPIAGDEVRAGRAGVAAGRHVLAAADAVLGFLDAEREPLWQRGRLSVSSLDLLLTALVGARDAAASARAVIDAAPVSRIAALRDGLAEIGTRADEAERTLSGLLPVLQAVRDAAAGGDPFEVLLLLENAAEARATGGLMGFVGTIRVTDGRLGVGRMEDVHALAPPGPPFTPVPAPADYVSRYGRFAANTDLWLNVNLSPDFPSVAQVAAALYETARDVHADAVVRADLTALGRLGDALGGITLLDGTTLPGADLASDFLVDTYARFGDDQDIRRAFLAATFVAVAADLLFAPEAADAGAVLDALGAAAAERRLAVFVPGIPEAADALAQLGADGVLSPAADGYAVTVQNFAANKIDIFGGFDVAFDVEPCGTGTATVTLRNAAPPGQPAYVDGPTGGAGRYWVTVYLPAGAVLDAITLDGVPASGSADAELGRLAVSTLVENLGRGETVTVGVAFRTPSAAFAYDAQPSVTPGGLSVRVGDLAHDGTNIGSVRLEAVCQSDPGSAGTAS